MNDAQLLSIGDIKMPIKNSKIRYIRKFDNFTIDEYLTKLSTESWNDIFGKNDVNAIFNNFHKTYLNIFESMFIKKGVSSAFIHNPWITKGIKISCCNKRSIYVKYRESNDISLKLYYKRCRKILTGVIKLAK
jgi:hypothetical protein